MKRYRRIIFAAVASLMFSGICLAQSLGTEHRATIVYEHRSSSAGQTYQPIDVYSVSDDGTNRKALTQDHHSHSPSWSPDGRHILFIHNSSLQTAPYSARPGAHNTSHPVELYVMDRDGGNAHLLRRLEPMITSAAWSPDGKMLAVTFNGGLYLLPADGGGEPRPLFPYVSSAAWSPDSRRLAFSVLAESTPVPGGSAKLGAESTALQWRIHIAEADGSMEREVTSPAMTAQMPAWSPEGKEIAFSGTTEGPSGTGKEQIFVMNQDGSEVRQLTNDPHWEACWHPSWSPDGRRIAFSCFASPPNCSTSGIAGGANANETPCTRRIFVTPAEGPASKLTPITDDDALNPAFAPGN